MPDNLKITPDLAQYLQDMDARRRRDTERILEDSKERHEHRDETTKANFEMLGAKYDGALKTSLTVKAIIIVCCTTLIALTIMCLPFV